MINDFSDCTDCAKSDLKVNRTSSGRSRRNDADTEKSIISRRFLEPTADATTARILGGGRSGFLRVES